MIRLALLLTTFVLTFAAPAFADCNGDKYGSASLHCYNDANGHPHCDCHG
jgi:hypothetical protein